MNKQNILQEVPNDILYIIIKFLSISDKITLRESYNKCNK